MHPHPTPAPKPQFLPVLIPVFHGGELSSRLSLLQFPVLLPRHYESSEYNYLTSTSHHYLPDLHSGEFTCPVSSFSTLVSFPPDCLFSSFLSSSLASLSRVTDRSEVVELLLLLRLDRNSRKNNPRDKNIFSLTLLSYVRLSNAVSRLFVGNTLSTNPVVRP